MNEEVQQISVIDAAKELGLLKQTLFKILKRLGVSTTLKKGSFHRGQKVAYITIDDYSLIQVEMKALGKPEIENLNLQAETENGHFYLIQLEPNSDPGRFKVGFASNISERLRKHRCSAPFSIVVATWPCKFLWEKTVIDCITQGCEKLHTEVFRTTSLQNVRDLCDQFFALMPKTQVNREQK